MLWIGYMYTINLVYHLSFLFWTDIWWDQLPLLLPKCFLNHVFHDQHLTPFSLRKFLCGKHRHCKFLCFQMTFHSFSFFNNVVLMLDTHLWRTGYFCCHFCGWKISCTCFFLEVNMYWPFHICIIYKVNTGPIRGFYMNLFEGIFSKIILLISLFPRNCFL